MLKIALINVPFGSVERPSIGLSQLQSVCREELGDAVQVELHYLNNAFAQYLGPDVYEAISSGSYYLTGLGDWLFRRTAFPEYEDNTEEYLARYFGSKRFYEGLASSPEELRAWVARCRNGFEEILVRETEARGLDAFDVVGMTSMFSQTGAALALARVLKDRNPGITAVLGGANAEGAMGLAYARHVPSLDYVFSGPALRSFPEFLRRIADSRAGGPLAPPPGVYQAAEAGTGRQVVTLGADRPIQAGLPPLDYDGFLDAFDEQVRPLGLEPTLLFETSRGCWWGELSQCTFCGLNGLTMDYRAMEADQAVQTIRQLFVHGERCSSLMSVDNIMPRGFAKEVLPLLETPAGTSLFYEVKANLRPSELAVMAAAGLRHIQPGIESLSTAHLKLMRKGTTSFRNIRLLEDAADAEIDVLWNLLVGFPGETEEPYLHYRAMLPLLTHLQPPDGIFPVRFDRFSPYFEQRDEYQLELEPADFYGLIYPFGPEFVREAAYYFTDVSSHAPYRSYSAKWLRELRGLVASWRQRWTQGSQPVLRVLRSDKGWTVEDTRASVEGIRYLLTDAEADALKWCRRPRKLTALSERVDPEVLSELHSHGLLFTDRGAAMSLLRFPQEGPQPIARQVPHDVEDVVRRAWRAALPGVEAEGNFFDLGGGSLAASGLALEVEGLLGITFPLEVLFLEGSLPAIVRECQRRYANRDADPDQLSDETLD